MCVAADGGVGGCMSTQERRESESGGGHVGSLFLATVLGVGVGLLAAPQSGTDTRRTLSRRLAALREGLGDEVEELEDASSRAGRAARKRAGEWRRRGQKAWDDAAEQLEELQEKLEEEDEEEGGSVVGTVLTVAAGLAAAAYFLSSERAAPARERVREMAATVRDEAEDRWERFQQRRNGERQRTTGDGTRIEPADSAPQPS
jgi:gas vesicle protein